MAAYDPYHVLAVIGDRLGAAGWEGYAETLQRVSEGDDVTAHDISLLIVIREGIMPRLPNIAHMLGGVIDWFEERLEH